MKKLFTLCFALLCFSGIYAQAKNPVSWTASYKSISATEGEIIITALIDKGWHTYSQKATADGPLPTAISFTESKQYQLLGTTEESTAHEEFDQAFGTKVASFSDKAEFRQKVRLTAKGAISIGLKVEYMCCDNNMCLPPKTAELSVKVQ